MNTRVDPVCGMTVDPATAASKFEYEGETYYFCAPNCLRKFSADPESYLKQAPQGTRAPQPMVQLSGKSKSLPVTAPVWRHAESHIDPVCGMTVDPMTTAGSYEHKGRRYYFCGANCLRKFRETPEAI